MNTFIAAFIIKDKEGTMFEDGPLDLKSDERRRAREEEETRKRREREKEEKDNTQ